MRPRLRDALHDRSAGRQRALFNSAHTLQPAVTLSAMEQTRRRPSRTITQPRPATFIARPEVGKDTSVTIRSAPVRPHQSLLPWGLTACAVVAGPPFFDASHASVAVASVAIALTALVIGFALRHGRHDTGAVAPVVRRSRTLGWSPP